ncbi:hypothetical protein BU16DRAFT_530885 [Lophium mytilinum]|uniref:Uncharacterized protein n=1 Tax=Lophium mytilinum TaxID=390894 RepID=A0A6A6QFJ8_9PEZI|nr:hypothetical protein BU16DRAFT_530885 [Lophium mytilinum]
MIGVGVVVCKYVNAASLHGGAGVVSCKSYRRWIVWWLGSVNIDAATLYVGVVQR